MKFVTLVAFACAMMASAYAQDNTTVASSPAAEEISVVRLIMVNHVDLSLLVDALGGSVINLFDTTTYGADGGGSSTTTTRTTSGSAGYDTYDTQSVPRNSGKAMEDLQNMRRLAAERVRNRSQAPY